MIALRHAIPAAIWCVSAIASVGIALAALHERPTCPLQTIDMAGGWQASIVTSPDGHEDILHIYEPPAEQ